MGYRDDRKKNNSAENKIAVATADSNNRENTCRLVVFLPSLYCSVDRQRCRSTTARISRTCVQRDWTG